MVSELISFSCARLCPKKYKFWMFGDAVDLTPAVPKWTIDPIQPIQWFLLQSSDLGFHVKVSIIRGRTLCLLLNWPKQGKRTEDKS